MTAVTSTTSAASSSSTLTSSADTTMIASNFTTFLQLLTTQLKNQDPLSPLDTNQFTQQLVEFAQVEQQMKSNTQLSTLISLNQTAQSTAALAYVGTTVVVDGSSTQLTNSKATWDFNVAKPATASVTITDSSGATVYSSSFTVNPGQTFTWDGKDNNGKQLSDGTYTLTASATDSNKQSVAISTSVQGTVDSVDLSQNPPLLSINGQNYTIDKIKKIIRAASSSSG
jgi:flagellar basal-body rod modification protein FlgD